MCLQAVYKLIVFSVFLRLCHICCNVDLYKSIQEEKLEPLKNTMDDPRIRLLNRLYARKRKELKERERLKVPNFIFCFIFNPSVVFAYSIVYSVHVVFKSLLCCVDLILTKFSFILFQNVEVEEEQVDQRSVDDLLSFINGANEGIQYCSYHTPLNCVSV